MRTKNKKKIHLLTLLSSVVLIVISIGSYRIINNRTARAFGGAGDGTQYNPFRITDCDQLFEINLNLSAHYSIVNNIDCSATSTWESGEGYQSIGTTRTCGSQNPFTGTLDGNNFTISNLYTSHPSTSEYTCRGGLFYRVDGTIKRLRIDNANITHNTLDTYGFEVGILANYFEGGTAQDIHITNSSVTNTSTTDGVTIGGMFGAVGGTGGYSFTDVSRVSFQGNLNGKFVGGITGSMSQGTIHDCSSNAQITLSTSWPSRVGGIASTISSFYGNLTVDNCYATGAIIGSGEAGGAIRIFGVECQPTSTK